MTRQHNRPGSMAALHEEPARLELYHVTVAYGEYLVLDDVTAQVPHGARVAVVGPNGAGKSTLFKALMGLVPLQAGQIFIHGRPLGSHHDCVAYVPQREEVDWHFPVTVADVVMMGRYGHLGWLRRPTARDRAIVQRSLEQLGIADLAERPIGALSGGQQRRTFLARALAQEPHILLMDEPFTGIDVATLDTTLQVLDQLRTAQVTVLLSTHDLNLAATYFDQVILLNRRLIRYGPPEEVLTPETIMETFGGQVFWLEPQGDGRRMATASHCCPPEQSISLRRQ
ncbi:MAG: metal ABC transporter ATP-binding protein [Anaerolineae bacterium]|nr:metal ABC transporter ATP-binding protein [Anaerolineae bacterium]MDW8070028.1 metal ABC transporter ATP-binding protein [Anaerolineae bacterium]